MSSRSVTIAVCLRCIILLGSAAWSVAVADAQDWEVMQIYIPSDPDQQNQVIPYDYMPIEIEDLQRELGKESDRRREAFLNQAELVDALYVCKLDGDHLVSDNSRWQLKGQPDGEALNLGRLSFSIRDSIGGSGDVPQLSDYARYSVDGRLEIVAEEKELNCWFGFSAKATSTAGKKSFSMKLPVAANAMMLIASPKYCELRSSDVAVEPVKSPREYLPNDWPSRLGDYGMLSGSSRWWLVHLSGADAFTLDVESIRRDSDPQFSHVVQSADIEYDVGQADVALRATYRVGQKASNQPIRLNLSESLRLSTIKLNGLTVAWQTVDAAGLTANQSAGVELRSRSGSEAPLAEGTATAGGTAEPLQTSRKIIELIGTAGREANAIIEVNAVGQLPATADVSLPSINIHRGFVLAGKTNVIPREGMRIDSDSSAGLPLTPSVVKPASESSAISRAPVTLAANAREEIKSRGKQYRWTSKWTGSFVSPVIQRTAYRPLWKMDAITTFTLQSDWLSAKSRIRVSCDHIDSNELRMQVGKDWFLDNVRLTDGSADDIRIEFFELIDGGERETEIVLNWEKQRERISLEFDVTAHNPRQTLRDRITLPASSLVSIPNVVNNHHFAIESLGRYRIEPTAQLVRKQMTLSELPQWKQALVAPAKDPWIFFGEEGVSPMVEFAATGGSYSAESTVLLLEDAEPIQLVYRIQCSVISGSVDRVLLSVPETIDLARLDFEMLEAEDTASIPIKSRLVSGTGSEATQRSEREVELELPSAKTSGFQIVANYTLVMDKMSMAIPLFGVPQATTLESVFVMPRTLGRFDGNLEPFSGKSDIELLPDASCCTTEQQKQFGKDLQPDSLRSMLAFRSSSNRSQVLTFRRPRIPGTSGWVEYQMISTRLNDNGQKTMAARWQLVAGDSQTMTVQQPNGWSVDYVKIDGQLNRELQFLDNSTFEVSVPAGEKAIIEAVFIGDDRTQGWLRNLRMQTPTLSLPVLNSKEMLELSPRLMPFSLPTKDLRESRLLDRLRPQNWWRILSPTSVTVEGDEIRGRDTELPMKRHSQWTRLMMNRPGEMDSSRGEGAGFSVWIIDRSAMAALLLSFVLITSAVFWMLCRRSVLLWWSAISVLALAVICVPTDWVPIAQLLLLSGCIAACGRMVEVIVRKKVFSNGGDSSRRQRVIKTLQTSLVFILLHSSAYGQNSSAASLNSSGAFAEFEEFAETARQEIFGVLIPVDENNALSSIYVQVPTRLWELLTRPEVAKKQNESPRILAADYRFDLVSRSVSTSAADQQLKLDLVVQTLQTGSELRLPFRASELELISASVRGQPQIIGSPAVNQNSDRVTIQIPDVGTIPLSLKFRAIATVDMQGRFAIAAKVPPLPISTLTVSSEGTSKIGIESRGIVQRLSSGELFSYLGPSDSLRINWLTTEDASPSGKNVGATAETWVHSAGEELIAASNLEVTNTELLPSTLHVSVDADWEPLGNLWGDAELESAETSAVGNRIIYTVRLNNSAKSVKDTARLSVLWVRKKDASGLKTNLPLLSLQEVSQQATDRIFAWSSDGDSRWSPEGTDFWERLPTSAATWDLVDWSAERTLYAVPSMVSSVQLRSKETQPEIRVAETTSLLFDVSRTSMKYNAVWEAPLTGVNALQLSVPTDTKIDEVLLNGSAVEFVELLGADAKKILVASQAQYFDRIFDLEVRCSLSSHEGTFQRVPRICLLNTTIRSSVVRFYHAAGTECVVQHDEQTPVVDRLQLAVIPQETTEQLKQLKVLLGEAVFDQAQLREDQRDVTWLPLEFKVNTNRLPSDVAWLMYLIPNQDGWTASFQASWKLAKSDIESKFSASSIVSRYATQAAPAFDGVERLVSSGGMHFAFFDAPIALRDRIDTYGSPRSFRPAASSDRTTLCMVPKKAGSDREEIVFSFPLGVPAVNRAMDVPEVSFLGDKPLKPIFALPKSVGPQKVAWINAGRPGNFPRLREFTGPKPTVNGIEFELYRAANYQGQMSWQAVEENSRESEVKHTDVRLTSISRNRVAGAVDYWVLPNGRLSAEFEMPKNLNVIGIQSGTNSAVWNYSGDSIINVTLQPNYLPVRIKMLVEWSLAAASETLSVPLPTPINMLNNGDVIVREYSIQGWELDRHSNSKDPVNNVSRGDLLNRWARFVSSAIVESQQSLSTSEIEGWMKEWSPKTLGLGGSEELDWSIVGQQSESEVEDPRQVSVSVADFWESLCNQHGISVEFQESEIQRESKSRVETVLGRNFVTAVGQPGGSATWSLFPPNSESPIGNRNYRINETDLSFSRVDVDNGLFTRFIAAALVGCATLLAYMVAYRMRFGYFHLLSTNPWVYWLQLGAVCWLALPLPWPSYVLAFISAMMFVSQVFDTKGQFKSPRRV